jgi:hypothetical protein
VEENSRLLNTTRPCHFRIVGGKCHR